MNYLVLKGRGFAYHIRLLLVDVRLLLHLFEPETQFFIKQSKLKKGWKEALIKIWGDDDYFNGRSMDVYITKIRKILKKDETRQERAS